MTASKTFHFCLAMLVCLGACDMKPRACFQMLPEHPHKSDTVRFLNCSKNASEFLFDFGDGSASTLENPVHTFDRAGNFKVRLTAEGNRTSDEQVMDVAVGKYVLKSAKITEKEALLLVQTLWLIADGQELTQDYYYTVGFDFKPKQPIDALGQSLIDVRPRPQLTIFAQGSYEEYNTSSMQWEWISQSAQLKSETEFDLQTQLVYRDVEFKNEQYSVKADIEFVEAFEEPPGIYP